VLSKNVLKQHVVGLINSQKGDVMTVLKEMKEKKDEKDIISTRI